MKNIIQNMAEGTRTNMKLDLFGWMDVTIVSTDEDTFTVEEFSDPIPYDDVNAID